MAIDITNKNEKKIALTGTQIEETLLQAHLSKDAIEKIEGLGASASEINFHINRMAHKPINISNYLFYGASIMTQTFTETEMKALIDSTYSVNSKIYNKSVPGRKLQDAIDNWDSDTASIIENNMLVILHIGGNDITVSIPYSTQSEAIKENMRKKIDILAKKIIDRGWIPVFLDISYRKYEISGVSLENNGTAPYNESVFKPKALEYSPYFCFYDGESIMQNYKTYYNDFTNIISSDGTHPTDAGEAILRQRFVDTIAYFNYNGVFPYKKIDKKVYTTSKTSYVSCEYAEGNSLDHFQIMKKNTSLDLYDSYGFKTGYKISSANFAGGGPGIVSTLGTGFLKDKQFKYRFYFDTKIPYIEISGLDNAKTYTIRVSGSSGATDLRTTGVTIDGVLKTYNTSTVEGGANYTDGVVFSNISPTLGIIKMTFTLITGAAGYVCGFDLIEN